MYGKTIKNVSNQFTILYFSFKRFNSEEPVIYFQSDKLMKVNFNPDIELLIREVKMLKILGYSVSSEIELVSETGSKFLRQAKCLEQVRNKKLCVLQ